MALKTGGWVVSDGKQYHHPPSARRSDPPGRLTDGTFAGIGLLRGARSKINRASLFKRKTSYAEISQSCLRLALSDCLRGGIRLALKLTILLVRMAFAPSSEHGETQGGASMVARRM